MRLRATSSGEWSPVPPEALLIAAEGGKFHMMDCVWAPEIYNSYFYLACEQAIADGFPACRTCKPRQNHPKVLRAVPQELVREAERKFQVRQSRAVLVHSLDSQPVIVCLQFADGEVATFQLVSSGQGDGRDQISSSSPLGAAILEAKEGEIVHYVGPTGELHRAKVLYRR